MTKFNKFKIDERQEMFERDNFTCVICKRSVNNTMAQAGHIIKYDIPNRNRYGDYALMLADNMHTTCGLICNKKAELREFKDSTEYQAHIIKLGEICFSRSLPMGSKLKAMTNHESYSWLPKDGVK